MQQACLSHTSIANMSQTYLNINFILTKSSHIFSHVSTKSWVSAFLNVCLIDVSVMSQKLSQTQGVSATIKFHSMSFLNSCLIFCLGLYVSTMYQIDRQVVSAKI